MIGPLRPDRFLGNGNIPVQSVRTHRPLPSPRTRYPEKIGVARRPHF